MRNFLSLVFLLFYFNNLIYSQAGSGTLDIITECNKGCASSCSAFCGTTVSMTCSAITKNLTINIPANTDATIELTVHSCSGDYTDGWGWEPSDIMKVGGFSQTGSGTSVQNSLTKCFATTSSAGFVIITIIANRKDEALDYNVTFVPNGGVPGAGCVAPTLPVDWISFTSEIVDQNVLLKWAVAEEKNVFMYEIERSNDGIQFDKIGEINVKSNDGTKNYYTYLDLNPSSKLNYYRIKNIDTDGKSSYTNISSTFVNKNNIFLLSTISSSKVEFVIDDYPNVFVNIIDLNGKIIREKIECDNGKNQINIDDIPVGMYFLQFKSNNNLINNFKFVKI